MSKDTLAATELTAAFELYNHEQCGDFTDLTSEQIFNAGFDAGAASVSRKEVVEWEFSKVRKIVVDIIPEHHRTGTAGVVYAAMIAAMDAVLTDLEAKK